MACWLQCCGDKSRNGAVGAYNTFVNLMEWILPLSSSIFHLTVPLAVAVIVPPIPDTVVFLVLGGSTKSFKLFVTLVVQQLSTAITNESESNLVGSFIRRTASIAGRAWNRAAALRRREGHQPTRPLCVPSCLAAALVGLATSGGASFLYRRKISESRHSCLDQSA